MTINAVDGGGATVATVVNDGGGVDKGIFLHRFCGVFMVVSMLF